MQSSGHMPPNKDRRAGQEARRAGAARPSVAAVALYAICLPAGMRHGQAQAPAACPQPADITPCRSASALLALRLRSSGSAPPAATAAAIAAARASQAGPRGSSRIRRQRVSSYAPASALSPSAACHSGKCSLTACTAALPALTNTQTSRQYWRIPLGWIILLQRLKNAIK